MKTQLYNDLHIHQDGHPLKFTNILFPEKALECARVGFLLGFGFTIGAAGAFCIMAALAKLIGALGIFQ